MGLTTASETADVLARITDRVDLPVIVDADTGYGNALNVQRTVRTFERAGAAMVQLEDQDFPKRCGHFENKAVVSTQEMVQKIKAALDTRRSADFLILARTDARAVEGFDAALDRMAAYKEAGADLLFVEAPTSRLELQRITLAVPGRHIANVVYGGKTPMLPREDFAALGFAGVLYANAALQAAMLAMQRTLAHLQQAGSLAGAESDILGFEDRQKFVDQARWLAIEKRYGSTGLVIE